MGRSLPLAIVHKMLSKRNRRPANRRRSRQVEPLEPRIVLDSTAVFNELMYHPRAEDGLEWIELHNQQGVDFDISGWQLDGGVEYTFPEGTIMDGGGYLVISANPSLSGIPGALGPFTGSLANGGEEVLLLNNSGRILDRIDYGDNTPWPVGADGSGVTLAKKSPNLGTEDVNNWTVSAQVGGTPGGLNFIGNTLVFTTEDLITPGDTAEVHVPTDASLGTDWTDPAYVLGTHGESWSVLSSSSGYVDGAMNQSYQDIVLADSPLAYWRLSESAPGSPAVNLGTLGAAANGTYAANVNLGGDSLVREAGDTSLGIPKNLGAIAVSSPEFEKVNTGRTMEFWVGVDELPTIAMDVVGDAQVGITFGMYITLQPTGYLRVTERTNINFVGISQVQIEQPLEEGETYHVVVTRTESTGELHAYINGQSVAITSVSGAMPNTGASVNTNNPIFIGNSARSTSGNAALRMDEVAIYNYPLSAVRASSHYDGGRVQFNQLFQSEISGMVNSSSSAYLRSTFSVPQNVDYSSLTLNINYDDGFVAYLNGVEVARRNISGSPGFDSTADSSRTLGEASTTESIPLGDYLNLLEPTGNVLAVHGVNVDAADEDFMVSYGLSAFGVEKPVVLDVPIRLSEVSSAMATDFSIELENPTDSAVDVTGVRIVSDGDIVDEYVLPSTSIPAHGFLSLTQADLGFRPADGDRLFVYNPAGTQLIDARVVTNRLRGLSPEHDNRWLYPSLATPGAANVFDINSDIVINEIFYNAPIRRAEPAVVEKFEVVPFDLEWRYNASDQNLGSGWQNNTYAVNNTTWFSGAGPIGYTNVELPVPLGTSIGVQGIFERTYYFQTEFTFDGNPTGLDLTLTSLIDDGAVIYLNGQEIQRIRMPDGPIDGTTAATESPTTSDFDDPITLPDELFVVGQNTLSVEVHRGPFLSPVVVMGLEIAAVEVVTPAQPQTDPDEQWIELYNRGTEAVDISNWAFADGVSFDVPAGTIVQPGEYVVVANDEVELAAKYPEVRILGEFSGNISRSGDRLELVDAANNPVDTVDFKDGGRWDGLADSGGSSLELKDPFADNSIPEAWQASDGSDNGEWQTITYRGRATTSNAPTTYNELVLGLLDSGEVLLDDIQVTQDPDGTARQLIQNGTFESDTVGMPASTWRIIGTHEESHVVVDPDDSSNQVLKLVATGPTEHMHNHAETTLKDGANYVSINSSLTYEISFRAKWLSGSDQLHSRLYFNRLPLTSHLARSENWGTPGLANSTAVDNIGPTYSNLLHGPTVPAENQDIRISVNADDPDGIQQMLVYYAVDGGAFSTVSMTTSGNGEYVGVIPGQPAESIIQFYVEGTDSRGAVSTFPAAGPDSRALIQVQDDAAGNLGSHNFRIVMTTTDSDRLHLNTNVMSNARIGATVIYDESEIYYDVGVRLKGSERGRNKDIRVGFNVKFDPMQYFRGVQSTVAIDRSGAGDQYSQKEILVKQTLNHAGGVTDLLNDVIYLVSPRRDNNHDGSALLQMSRYGDDYLDSQFDNGSDGGLFKFELIYYPTTTTGGPEGLKIPEPDNVLGVALRPLGDSADDHRWFFLNRNKVADDDYSGLIGMLETMALSGDAFHAQAAETLDVDFWLRSFAVQHLWGVGDNYATGGNQHNAYFYIRPSDGKTLYFPWDVDFSGSLGATSSLVQNGELTKMLTLPENMHRYYGHIYDILNTSFNNAYMDDWIDHYESFLTNQSVSLQTYKSYISQRSNFATTAVSSAVPNVAFAITNNSGNDFTVNSATVTLTGRGWVDVREIRLAGNATPLDISWPTSNSWQAVLPVTNGANPFSLEAYDFQGNLIATDSITVTSTVPNPVVASLRIAEVNYHPTDPTAAELAVDGSLVDSDFEYVEFVNVGTDPINPTGTQFTNGISYTFPSMTIGAGERVVVARNAAAFQLRYGSSVTPIGEFASGGLSNGGERLTLVDGTGEVILDFSYSDSAPWPEAADGLGATLELIDPTATPADNWGKFQKWRSSTEVGGSPGTAGAGTVGVVVNELLTNSETIAHGDAIELLNTTASPIDIGGWYLSDSSNNLFKFQIPAETVLEPGGRLVLDERDFNPTPLTPGPDDFALNGNDGDDVWLTVGDGDGGVLSFVEEIHFGAVAPGQTLGRLPDGSGAFAPLGRASLGCDNESLRAPSVLISELNAAPEMPSPEALAIDPALTSDDLEYIEVYNASTATVDLSDWRIRGGADYDFVTGQLLAPGETLLVLTFNPANAANATRVEAFQTHYGIDSNVTLVGGLSGQLSDTGERIDLQQPIAPPVDDPTNIPHVSADVFIYENSSPWPTTIQGTGRALTRRLSVSNGNLGTSWSDAAQSPGSVSFETVAAGDVNADGTVNSADIDALLDVVHSGRSLAFYDLDGSGVTDSGDVEFLVSNLLSGVLGDANLDGTVDGTDFGVWNDHRFAGCGTWSTGDFNGDGLVDGSDFNIWNAYKFTSHAAPASLAGIPRAALPAGIVRVPATLVDSVFDEVGLTEDAGKTSVATSGQTDDGAMGAMLTESQPRVRRMANRSQRVARRESAVDQPPRSFESLVDDVFGR